MVFFCLIMFRKTLLVVLSALLFWGLCAFAQEEEDLPLEIEGEDVEYLLEEGLVIAIREAAVTCKDIKILADKIKIYVNKNEVEAISNVRYDDGKNTIRGERLFYNTKTESGYFENISRAFFEPWYWKGKRVDIISPRQFVLIAGEFTTCSHIPPHYHFSSARTEVHLDENLRARHIFMRIGKMPVLYFPYYSAPLEHPPYGLVNWIGHSSEKGWMDLMYYNWYVHPDFRGRTYLDYIEKLGWGEGFDLDYNTKKGRNYLYAYYMDEDENFYEQDDISRVGGESSKRWKGIFKHRQAWKNDFYTTMKVERYSDENFNKDFFSEETKKGWDSFPLSRDEENYISLERIKPTYNWTALDSLALNDFEHKIERKPQISFSTRERRWTGTPFHYKWETHFAELEEVFPESEDREDDISSQRIYLAEELSSPQRVTSWLVSEPYLNLEETWYSDNINNDEAFRSSYKYGWNLRSKLYHDYSNSRHIFQPQIGYYRRPEVSLDQKDLFHFDYLDRLASQEGFYVEFINRLKSKEEVQEPLDPADEEGGFSYRESLDSRIWSNYSLEEDEWEYIFLENNFSPLEGIILTIDGVYNPRADNGEILTTNLSVNRSSRWNCYVGSQYYREEDVYNTTGGVGVNLGAFGNVRLDATYDIEDSFWKDRRITLNKNLHCWIAQLQVRSSRRSEEVDSEFEVFLLFTIKGLGWRTPGISWEDSGFGMRTPRY